MSGGQLLHGGPPRACSCCLIPEDHDSGQLVAPDGLCMACQPCPICGETGGPCYDNGNYAVCLAPESTR